MAKKKTLNIKKKCNNCTDTKSDSRNVLNELKVLKYELLKHHKKLCSNKHTGMKEKKDLNSVNV